MEIIVPIVLLLTLMFIGMPVAWSMMLSGLVGILWVTGSWNILFGLFQTIPFRESTNFALTTVPMFVFLGYLLMNSRIAADLFEVIATWTSGQRGGLATGTVYTSVVFGAMSGATTAAASVLSSMAIPPMRKYGYSDALSSGTVAVGSTLSVLVPPSILLIIYGIATETSIGDLFLAGVVPGLLLAALVALVVVIWTVVRPDAARRDPRLSLRAKITSTRAAIPSVILIVMMLGALYSGIATPTEVAAVGAFGALVIGFSLRRLTFQLVVDALRRTVKTSAFIFALLIGATFFKTFLAYGQVPQKSLGLVRDLDLSPTAIIIVIAVAYLIGCAVMDEVPFMLLTLPITFPLITAAGFDPVWFGIFSALLISIGLIAPPVGLLSFIVSGESKIPIGTVYRGASIMVLPILVLLVAVSIWPAIALWLPSSAV